MTQIWRLTIKTDASDGVDPREFCLTRYILGIGWPIQFEGSVDWETYKRLAKNKYGDRGWRAAINAIHDRMQQDDLCWTRDWNGIYYLGRITSDWRYENTPANIQADVVNVRGCDWKRIGTVDAVPGKVVNSFAAQSTVQQVHDDTVRLISEHLYNTHSQHTAYPINKHPADLFSVLSADDCEDIVGLYLQQEKGYALIPSSCKRATAAYEYVLKHLENGRKAVAQVKNGNVDLDTDDYAAIGPDTDVYLLTTKGTYKGGKHGHVFCLSVEEILAFIQASDTILPDRIQAWINLLGNI